MPPRPRHACRLASSMSPELTLSTRPGAVSPPDVSPIVMSAYWAFNSPSLDASLQHTDTPCSGRCADFEMRLGTPLLIHHRCMGWIESQRRIPQDESPVAGFKCSRNKLKGKSCGMNISSFKYKLDNLNSPLSLCQYLQTIVTHLFHQIESFLRSGSLEIEIEQGA